jgi:hypothetical protein
MMLVSKHSRKQMKKTTIELSNVRQWPLRFLTRHSKYILRHLDVCAKCESAEGCSI